MRFQFTTLQQSLPFLVSVIMLGVSVQSLAFSQNDDEFRVPPMPAQSNQDLQRSEIPQQGANAKLPPLSFNDLRGPTSLSENTAGLQPMKTPERNENAPGTNSILQRAPQIPNIGHESTERKIPVFNPREFDVPPVHENAQATPIQSSRANQSVSPESFRMSDSGFVRQASANMQDEGGSRFSSQPGAFSNSATPSVQSNLSGQSGSLSPGALQLSPRNPNASSRAGVQSGNNSLGSRTQFNQNQNTPPAGQVQRQNLGLNQAADRQRIASGAAISPSNPNSAAPVARPNTAIAKGLMAQYRLDNSQQALPGDPVSLRQLLEQTSPQNRPGMVGQYWLTYHAWCDVICCSHYASALNQVTDPRNPVEKNLLNTARSIANDELLAAELHLARAQSRLQQYMPNSQDQLVLPLPSDQPLITSYTTHYDFYASRRSIPNEIRNIATNMPQMLTLISQRASTAQSSQASMNQVRQFAQGGQAPVVQVLQAIRMWSDANKALVKSVVNYNRSIAAYSMNVLGTHKPVEQLAIALVGKPKSSTALDRADARQATLPMEYRPREMQSGGASTFTPRSGGLPQGNLNLNQPRPGNPNGQGNLSGGQSFQIPDQGQSSRGGFSNQPGSFRGN